MTVAVYRNGKPLYVRGYGLANVELSRPNGPDVIYPIGSISKQFTAFCIQLLAQEGKLSLQDDVRRYVPELHDFGTPITINMLLHHTSGLRESVSLLNLKGFGPEDVTTRQEALDLIYRQTALNFPPGTKYLYSNSNYILLGLVVERVSGMKLADFLRQRIFEPLRMNHTFVATDPASIIHGRAYGYGRVDGRYVPRMSSDSILGPSGILTTVADLEKWELNFDSARAGGRAVIDAMEKPGVLSDGTPITYASGLHVEHFHGLPFLEHSGYIWGFKSDLLHFPRQHFTVIVLANTDNCDPPELAFSVAAIYLKNAFPAPPKKPKAITISPALLDRYIGTYEIATGTTMRAPGKRLIFRRDDFLGEHAQLAASSKTDFFALRGDFRVTFVPASNGGPSQRAIVHEPSGDNFVARRVPPARPAAPLPAGAPTELSAYVGRFYSKELDVLYTVTLHDGKLWMRYPQRSLAMRPEKTDTFLWNSDPVETITFTRDARGIVSGFFLTEQRVQHLRFVKVQLRAISGEAP